MKLVTAVIKPHKWEDVREALETFGVTGMTVSEVSGYGRQKGHTEVYRGAEYDIALVPKIRHRDRRRRRRREDVVGIVVKTAQTGRIGDGKVWVSPVETVVRVRTGDQRRGGASERSTGRRRRRVARRVASRRVRETSWRTPSAATVRCVRRVVRAMTTAPVAPVLAAHRRSTPVTPPGCSPPPPWCC